jgi:sigma-B regulation protein RsbQ
MHHALNVNILESSSAGDLAAGPNASPATLLFAHGYGCDQHMWHAVAQALPEARRILFDWPGSGLSDPAAYDPVRHATLDGYADDLLALIAVLDLRDVIVVGHSVAASIAAVAACRDPARLGALVLVSPSPCFLNDLPDYPGGFERPQLDELLRGLSEGQAAWARAVAPMVMGNPERPGLAQGLEASFCAMDPTIAQRWARVTFLSDIRAILPTLRTPCLVLQSRDDALASEAIGQWVASQVPGSRYELLTASGHCPHVSAPQEVAQVLRRHLAWRG